MLFGEKGSKFEHLAFLDLDFKIYLSNTAYDTGDEAYCAPQACPESETYPLRLQRRHQYCPQTSV